MLKEKISGFIDTIRSIDRVAACALVSYDGIAAGKYFDRDLNKPWGELSSQQSSQLLSRLEALSG